MNLAGSEDIHILLTHSYNFYSELNKDPAEIILHIFEIEFENQIWIFYYYILNIIIKSINNIVIVESKLYVSILCALM